MKRNILALAVTSVLTIFSAACAKKAINDQALTTAVQSKLYADSTVRQGNIAVAVKDGVVTLSGEAPNSDVELAAVKVANGTEGVRNVQDQIKVTAAAVPAVPAPDPGAPAPSNLASKTTPVPAPAAKPEEPAPASMPEPEKKVVAAPAPKKPIVPETVTIPVGTRLAVRTGDTIDSKTAVEGGTYRASLDSPLISRGRVVVPAGSDVTLTITNVKSAGRIKGNSALSLRATGLQHKGKSYELASSVFADQGKGRGKETALKTGIGAAAGALIGGLAGGGKGAGIGAAAGGGAGFGWNAFTHGQQVKIPAETVLNFKLESPLVVPMGRGE